MNPGIKKVQSSEDLNQFIRLPWNIYTDDPNWVPPLIFERKKFLNPQINPFFEHAEMELFMVIDNSKPVGRIALILDKNYNEFHSEKTGFFGMFECVNDKEPAALLFEKAKEWCQENQLDRLLGPMNLSTNHECGLMLEGFEDPPMVGIPYNPPYYSEILERNGFTKAKDLLSYKLDYPNKIPDYMERANKLIQKRNRFTLKNLQMEDYANEVKKIWDLYNSAWSYNWGFVPMNFKEFEYFAQEIEHFVLPEMCFIAYKDDEPVGFSLTLPDINQILKTMNGRLFPSGFFKFILNRKKVDTYRVLTLGVKKKYQRTGIDVVFYYETYKQCIEKHVRIIEMSWVLEDNLAMVGPLERMGAILYKRHRIYEHPISNA